MAAIQNRKLPIPENTEEFHEIRDKEARIQDEILQRTEQFGYICYQKFQSYLIIYIYIYDVKLNTPLYISQIFGPSSNN